MINTQLFEEYAKVRAQMDTLELMEKALKTSILEDMQKNKAVKEQFEYGSFTVASRKTYLYTPKVLEMEEKVKIAKLREVEKGIADIKETHYVTYKAK